eukprot:ctg_393.g205
MTDVWWWSPALPAPPGAQQRPWPDTPTYRRETGRALHRRPRGVLDLVRTAGRRAVLLEERARLGVAAGHHVQNMDSRPRVHQRRTHETDVRAQVAVRACAVDAEEDAVGGGGPRRIVGLAVETLFVFGTGQ